jgi:hypothetical protein
MSRRAHAVESDEAGDDELAQVNWFKPKQGRGKYQRKGKAARKPTGPPVQTEIQEPAAPEAYLGDPTEQEVIDNVRALPDFRSGGKVCVVLITRIGLICNIVAK